MLVCKLSTSLKDYGFKQCVKDYSLFIFADADTRIHVLVYVDDLIVTGSSPQIIAGFKTCIEVARYSESMYLCQRKYTLDIICDSGLLGAKPVSHSLEQDHHLARAGGAVLPDPFMYHRLVGRLIYLSVTRPDISYAIHMLSQVMNAPQELHWEAALRVCDADYAGCTLSRRSLMAWFIQLGGSPVSWRTRKQDVVLRSSAEAEYRSMAVIVCELLCLRELLMFLGVDCSYPIPLHCDNQSAIHISKNPVFHEWTKHIETDCHFIRDEILCGVIAPQYVGTKEQLADILTKALGRKEFDEFHGKLGICDLHTPT
ncbi:PREDICTED: uncharacterized protein LOC109127356 [Camelina sativa]|uniref:Uncharacterized protein LOC109127356 n=1 Tax=Camelina sativa TaxID=90675 RepID=A0ABM1QL71_CAMSA|nr:PREDICTED: uncharacterized protein LOC109127356 [Camelina sativa]